MILLSGSTVLHHASIDTTGSSTQTGRAKLVRQRGRIHKSLCSCAVPSPVLSSFLHRWGHFRSYPPQGSSQPNLVAPENSAGSSPDSGEGTSFKPGTPFFKEACNPTTCFNYISICQLSTYCLFQANSMLTITVAKQKLKWVYYTLFSLCNFQQLDQTAVL